MYTAKINGQDIDLGDITITMRLKNPMFDDSGGMEGTSSYPFKLPATVRNKAIIGFPARLTRPFPQSNKLQFEHYVNGIKLPGNTFCVIKASDILIEGYITIGRSEFISSQKAKSLQALTFDDIVISDDISQPIWTGEYIQRTLELNDAVAFPLVKNEGLHRDGPDDVIWNNTTTRIGPFQNAFFFEDESSGAQVVTNPDSLTPMPYVNKVLKQICLEAGYVIKKNSFDDNHDLSILCIYNPNLCEHIYDAVVASYGYVIKIQNHLPNILIPEFLVNIRVPFGIDAYFNHNKHEISLITRKDIINSTEIPEDWCNSVARDKMVYLDTNMVEYSFTMKQDSSDEYWQTQVKDFSTIPIMEESPIDLYTQLPSSGPIGSIVLVLEFNAWYRFNGSWEFYSYNWSNIKIGTDGGYKMEGDIAPLANGRPALGDVGVYSGIGVRMPVTIQKGNRGNFPLDYSSECAPFSLRLLSNTGQLLLGTGFYRCYGASLFQEGRPSLTDASWDLSWKSPEFPDRYPLTGLYENWWKEWITWRKRSVQVEFTKLISPLEMFNLDFTKKYKVFETVFVLDEINFTVTTEGIQPAKVKAWTV